jgi:outer membrane protein TolC
VATQSAITNGHPFQNLPGQGHAPRLDLHYLRASGLAQARLQLAVLSGNRHRALEQIDRLVSIDKQLERVADGGIAIAPPAGTLAAELADERLAIASEKLALTAGIEMPRLDPAFGAGLAAELPMDEPVEIVEEQVLRRSLFRLALGAFLLLVLFLGLGAALTQL